MKKTLLLIASIAPLHAAEPASNESTWTQLLDEKLSQWETYLGVPDPSVEIPGYTHAEDRKQGKPLGVNHDPLKVFTVKTIDGDPVLHVTGQIFGVITTLKTYGDFHLRTQFRWGTIKHAPRTEMLRDSGILYHAFGDEGAIGGFWKQSLECQVQESDIGDFYSLGGTANVSTIEKSATDKPNLKWRYGPGGTLRRFKGRCSRGTDYHELPNGEWNTIEIMSVGDRSIHILNGKVVNVLQDARTIKDPETPLVSGQIQFQSEGAECDYRRIEIRPLGAFPQEYLSLFSVPPAN
jgi:hypothetical protein